MFSSLVQDKSTLSLRMKHYCHIVERPRPVSMHCIGKQGLSTMIQLCFALDENRIFLLCSAGVWSPTLTTLGGA